jgi:cytochrome c biogenesis protein CcdA
MLGLLITTILTSAADSLNPIAITQQFVLQGMVKKPKHIWFFIIPTGVTNLIGGFLAYFGLVTFIGDFFGMLMDKYGQMLYTFELILGIVFLIALFYLVHNTKIESLKKQISDLNSDKSKNNDETEAAGKIKSVSPPALLALGTCATISELTTALPYFAFLAILFNYQLSFAQVAFILIVYNTIYTLPLIILYFVYIKAQDKFDNLYTIIKTRITKWANIIAPTAVGLIGSIMIFHSVSLLLK